MIKTVTFKNAKGETITGVLKEKNTSGPLLICGHGLNGSKEHPATEGITNMLYTMGHSSFSFDVSKSAQGFSLKEQVIDTLEIIDHFSNHKNIFLFAPSLGALSMVIAAIQSAKVKGIITVNGFFGTAQLGNSMLKTYLIFRFFALFKKEYQRNWKYFKEQYQPQKIHAKVLVMHAKHDDVVSIVQSQMFYKKLSGKKEFVILEDADHELTRESYMKETAVIVDRWLKQ